MGNPRMIIDTNDVARITGKSERAARRTMIAIRKKYNRPPKSPVPIHDFCNYFNLEEEKVMQRLL